MAYIAPTASDFKIRFGPNFDTVGEPTITAALGRAARAVDDSWLEGDFAEARMLYAAHDLASEGVGTSPDALSVGEGNIKRRRGADHEIEFFQRNGSGAVGANGIETTIYGRKFLALLAKNFAGPRATGGCYGRPHHLARDWPC